LETAKTYYYTIVAESECEESAQSIYGFATTTNCENKPVAPANIRAEALSSTDIDVSWDAASGAKSYAIYIKQEGSGVDYYRAIGKLTSTSYTVSGRHPLTTYSFKISAENDCGESDMSTSYATATTQDCDLPILSAPTGVTATALSAKTVLISWNAVNGAVYDIYRTTDMYGSWWTVSGARDLTGTSFADTTLSSSTMYYYVVKSVNSCGKSADGIHLEEIVSVTTMCETPIPVNVAATAKSSGSIEVTWDAVSGATSYSVYRATRNPNNQYTLLGKISGTNTTYTDNGLENLTSYYYKITAKTATCDDSKLSAYAAGTTQ
jgi:fibronectin type 3 domain-containing protein